MKVYAVVRGDGTLKWSRGGGLAIYTGRAIAQGQAKAAGDCVVVVDIDLTTLEPIFIRGRKLDGST